MKETTTNLIAARGYHAAGLSVIPIKHDGSKVPARAWKQDQRRRSEPDEITKDFRDPRCGIAVVHGKVSGNTECVDVDNAGLFEPFRAAVEAHAPGLIGKLCTVRTPRPGVHLYYRCEVVAGNQTLAQSSDGKTLIETRGEGGYTLAPGSPPCCHPSGATYDHVAGPPLTALRKITPAERDTLFAAARSLNQRAEPRSSEPRSAAPHSGDPRPGDDFNARAEWADILTPHGWEQTRQQGGKTFWRRPGKDDGGCSADTGVRSAHGNDLLCVFSTNAEPFAGAAAGKPCTTYTKFAAYAILNHGGDYVAATRQLAAEGYGKSDAADDFTPIKQYEPFPVEALPEPARSLVAEGAAAIGCDPSYLALPLLAGLAGAIGNSTRLRLKDGWDAPAILWTLVVGESGTAKSPAADLATRAFQLHERDARRQHAAAMQAFEAQGDDGPRSPAPEPERFVVSDVTVEGLAPILSANPRGLLLIRDELDGWLSSFNSYKRTGGDEAHWLSMHSARPMHVDRKTGAQRSIFVPHASVSITGGIQPGVLRRALGVEHVESGLAARFLLAYPPRRAKRWTERTVAPETLAAVAAVVERLYLLGDGVVSLAPDAKAVWVEAYDAHNREQTDHVGELAAAWAKLEETTARLALVIHSVRWAAAAETRATREQAELALLFGDAVDCDAPSCDAPSVDFDVLDADSMRAAITLVSWFKSEALRVYAMLGELRADAEQARLVEWVAGKGGDVTERETRQGCRWLRAPGAAEKALGDLVNAGRGVWETVAPSAQGGRPTRRFVLGPVYETPTNPERSGGFGYVDNVDKSKVSGT